MASVTAIRQALANRLTSIPGLRVSAQYQSQVNPPMAIIMPQPGQIITFDTIDGTVTYYMRIALLVSYAEDVSAQAALDAYLDPTGSGSVIGSLRADPDLAGVAHYVVPISANGYGLVDWAGQQYFGTNITVQVVTM